MIQVLIQTKTKTNVHYISRDFYLHNNCEHLHNSKQGDSSYLIVLPWRSHLDSCILLLWFCVDLFPLFIPFLILFVCWDFVPRMVSNL